MFRCSNFIPDLESSFIYMAIEIRLKRKKTRHLLYKYQKRVNVRKDDMDKASLFLHP